MHLKYRKDLRTPEKCKKKRWNKIYSIFLPVVYVLSRYFVQTPFSQNNQSRFPESFPSMFKYVLGSYLLGKD